MQTSCKICDHGTAGKPISSRPCMHLPGVARSWCCRSVQRAGCHRRVPQPITQRIGQRVSVRALSKAQQSLQELLRKAQTSTEVLQLVADEQTLLDSVLASTAVQKLAYLPTAYLDPKEYVATLTKLAHAVRCNLPALSSPIDMLAGFAELQFKSKATDRLLEVFIMQCDLSHELKVRQVTDGPPLQKQWDTVSWGWADNSDLACKNLVTVAWAFGRLLQHCDSDILNFMDSIAAELSKKLHNNLLKDAFTPDDLADTVDAFGNVCNIYWADEVGSSKGQMPMRNVGALMDTIAVDVRHQLSNKHSMRAPFVPGNLVKLLTGYSRLQHISSASSSMLDAAAGFVVRRMNAGHLNSVTKLSDLSQLLQAYARLAHSTVVMPELLTAVSNQLRKQLASESERQTKLELSRQIQADSEGNSMIPLLGSSVEPLHLISILKAYRDLGYHPSQGLLIAAEPFLCCLHSLMPSGPALDLISLFGAFDWRPGDLVLQQTAISLLEDVAQADPEGLASITAGLVELCHLGYTIPDGQLQQMHGRKKQLMNQHISM